MKNKTDKKKFKKRKIPILIILIIVVLYFIVFFYNLSKPLPENISLEGEIYEISEDKIEFLYDLTYLNETGSKVFQQEIFSNVFSLVDNAKKFIIIDMFLFNSDYSKKENMIPLTEILKEKLIKKKTENPNIKVYFITDEINNFYGSYTSKEIEELRKNGIEVIVTDLTKLRDSNHYYSSFWRIFLQPFGTSGKGWLTHPLGNEEYKVTLRSYLKLLNTKANHRKIIIADSGNEIHSIVTSGNPHEASSLHSNTAFLIKEDVWQDVLKGEMAVASFSNYRLSSLDLSFVSPSEEGNIKVQYLTEGKIKSDLIKDIDSTEEGESIDMPMFYLSDRDIISSLLKASERGVEIRLILDPNKDAFAREKNGIPNRQVAKELVKKSGNKIQIRWYDTYGEQFHTKMIIIKKKDKTIIYAGSANLTRRNIDDLNLEADVKVIAPVDSQLSSEVLEYFSNLWTNKGGNFTADFSKYEDNSKAKYLLYRFQEFSGFSSF